MRTVAFAFILLAASVVIPAPSSAFHDDECTLLTIEPADLDPLGVCGTIDCIESALQYSRWPRMMLERALACFVLA